MLSHYYAAFHYLPSFQLAFDGGRARSSQGHGSAMSRPADYRAGGCREPSLARRRRSSMRGFDRPRLPRVKSFSAIFGRPAHALYARRKRARRGFSIITIAFDCQTFHCRSCTYFQYYIAWGDGRMIT